VSTVEAQNFRSLRPRVERSARPLRSPAMVGQCASEQRASQAQTDEARRHQVPPPTRLANPAPERDEPSVRPRRTSVDRGTATARFQLQREDSHPRRRRSGSLVIAVHVGLGRLAVVGPNDVVRVPVERPAPRWFAAARRGLAQPRSAPARRHVVRLNQLSQASYSGEFARDVELAVRCWRAPCGGRRVLGRT